MWILLGGRLAESIAGELSKVSDVAVKGVEHIDDIFYTLEKQGKDYLDGVKGIIVLDASLSTLTNWDNVRNLAKLYEGIPMHVISRFPNMTPSDGSLGVNVVVEPTDKITSRLLVNVILRSKGV